MVHGGVVGAEAFGVRPLSEGLRAVPGDRRSEKQLKILPGELTSIKHTF